MSIDRYYEQQIKQSQNSASIIPSDSIPSFLLKTYEILQNDKYLDIICWTKTGEGFVVKKVKQFAEKVLPIHFRHSNYTSFVRQLNMYDFHKTRQQNQENAFKNFLFKKGRKDLLKEIQRKDYKKNKETRNQPSFEKPDIETTFQRRNDKDLQFVKDFYSSSLQILNIFRIKFEESATKLAQISQIPIKQAEMMQLLDTIFQSKRTNIGFNKKLNYLDKRWSSFIANRQLGLSTLEETQKGQKSIKIDSHKETMHTLPQ